MRDEGGHGRGRSGADHEPVYPDLAGDALAARLERWSAEARVDEAARARSRERGMREQATEESTFAGVLTDLAERRLFVLVHCSTGRRHRCFVEAVGVDFVGVRTSSGENILLRLATLEAVRTLPGEERAMSGRSARVDLEFRHAVEALMVDRPRVLAVTDGGQAFSGDLVAIGADVICVRADGDAGSHLYLPIDSLAEVGAL